MAENKDNTNEPLESFEDATENGYITLKEAAELSNYSSDYIGQLIRSGKLEGKQVYSNIAWVTTEKALYDYMQNKGKGQNSEMAPTSTVVNVYASPYFKYALHGVIGVSAVLFLVAFFIFSIGIDRALLESASANESPPDFVYE